jgi:hypothetical protein
VVPLDTTDNQDTKMIFLRQRITDSLVWAVRCKGCGEYYVTREVRAAEVTHEAKHQTILCHRTSILYEYDSTEFETIWTP